MPASLNISSYPLYLYETVESVLLTQRPAVIKGLADLRTARRVRQQIYNLKYALTKNPDHPLSADAPKITTILNDTTYELTVEHADHPSGITNG